MSRVEFLIQVLRRLIEDAGAPGARTAIPISLQVTLIIEELRRESAFAPEAAAAADRLVGQALNLELALEGAAPLEPARAAALVALEAFVQRLARDGPQ